jgi:cytochrome c-type biogenesis protein CcmE
VTPPVEPQPAAPARATVPGTASRRRLWLAGAIVVAALAFLVVQGLGNATLYFRTADEAVAQRESLGTRRFRIEGTVVAGSVRQSGDGVAFDIANNGVTVPVLHQGDPPEMFKPGIPVVLEGRFDGDHFASDRILVKHSETYIAEHPERVTTVPASPTGP